MFGHQMDPNSGNGNKNVGIDIKNVIPENEEIKLNGARENIESVQNWGWLISDPYLIQSLGKGTIPTQDTLDTIFQKMTDIEEKFRKILQGQGTLSGPGGTIGKMAQNSTSNLTTGSPGYQKSIKTFVKINSDYLMNIERDQTSEGRLSTLKESLTPIMSLSHSYSSLEDHESSSISQMNQNKPPLRRKSLFLTEGKSVCCSIRTPSNATVKHQRSGKTIDAPKQHAPNSRPSKATSRLEIESSGTPKKE
jgi:hypothetical protein